MHCTACSEDRLVCSTFMSASDDVRILMWQSACRCIETFDKAPWISQPTSTNMASKLTPLKDLKVLKYQIPAFELTPNTSIQKKPLLIYRSAFPSDFKASDIESHLSSVGVVTPKWRYTMYSFSHFHSNTHEVLGIASGKAKLCFGHESSK